MKAERKKHFTLAQAAKTLDVSIPTVRRMVLSEKVRAIKVMIGDRPRWEIPYEEVVRIRHDRESWAELPVKQNEAIYEASQKPSEEKVREANSEDFTKLNASESVTNANQLLHIPLNAHLAALELANTLQRRTENLQEQVDEAKSRAELAERQKLALEFQLRQYQVALSDQAESLAEERARRMALECKERGPLKFETLNLDLKVAPPAAKDASSGWGRRLREWLGLRTG